MSRPGQWSVGELYNGGLENGLPYWSQPDGPGTLVYPQLPRIFPAQNMGYPQTPMSYPAMYYFGCGHPLNCPSIQQVYDPYSETQVILLLCPMCSFIQYIYNPASTYYNYLETPIVVG
jgi:hypothetical protein